ncbi:conserved hypothetical protein [Methanohalobium evestigatum Z-7303]|uniref:DUF8180 domain-containing protein n=1 Tax=Methanohalobium evestigatum (strain ATCC BAA-1072 / DSM 3721 / NBRC 107634 / OCM 161 / Z-7303) TaxID=644295 RepID=D7E9F6_METEZ|nr:conserved hypothetical protein [Methanohalobium evestigatum Z-7303]
MTEDINKDKLEHLLEHWIEHNKNHSQSFNEWGNRIRQAGFEKVADELLEAEQKMDECTQILERAKEKMDNE